MAQSDMSSCLVSEDTSQPLTPEELAVTLPFEQQDVLPNVFQLAVDQTRKRWAWFSESRELDARMGTELGTLGYLPWEIRRQILKEILDYVFWYQRDPRTYRGQEAWPYDARHLRLSSPTLGLEFDELFLSNTIFKFEWPPDLGKFLGQMSSFHLTRLRRIIISIWVPCGCRCPCLLIDWSDGWKTMCLQLPASLQQVSFDLDCGRPWHHAESCRRHGEQVKLKEIKAAANQIKAAANLIEILSKRIVRSAPGAVVEMHESAKKRLLPGHLELFIAAVNDIER